MAKAGAAAAAAQEEPLLFPEHHQPPPPCYGIPVGAYHEPPQQQPYVLIPLPLPLLHRRRRRRGCPACCSSSGSSFLIALLAAALLACAAGFLLWPSHPAVGLSRVKLRSIRVSANRHGGVALDVDMDLKVRVYNPNLFALHYDRVTAEIGYRGQRLGSVDAGGSHLMARMVSYVEARLRVDGIWVLEDTNFLIEDIARGRVPLDAVTTVKGRHHLLGIVIPVKGKISCAVNVDVENQAILSQDCYPERP